MIYSFGSGSADGVVPSAALVPGSSGDLYGTTYSGGTNGYGTAFELIPSGSGWTEQVIHSFTGSDGAGPYAPLIQMGGNLYGTTYRGGANSSASGSDGTAFELIPSGSGWNEQVIYNFAGGAADGANPQASLIPGSNGDLYGTTYRGGTSGVGTVFKIVP